MENKTKRMVLSFKEIEAYRIGLKSSGMNESQISNVIRSNVIKRNYKLSNLN